MQSSKSIVFKTSLTFLLLAMSLLFPQAQASRAIAAVSGEGGHLKRLEVILQPMIDAAKQDGIDVSIAVKDLSGTYGHEMILLGSQDAYLSASTIKLAIVSALMREIEAGRLSLDQKVTVAPASVVGGAGSLQSETFPQDVTVERLARLMITQSDNTATNVLIDLVGFDKVNALIDGLGFTKMQLGRKMMTPAKTPEQDNYVSAAELVTLLDKMYNSEVVSAASRDQIIAWMKAQEVKTKFGAALPGKPIAHKTGELGDVSHDTGYFLIPGREIAIVVLTRVTRPEDAGQAQKLGNPVVQRVAKAVYNELSDTPAAPHEPSTWPEMSVALHPIIDNAAKRGIRVSVGMKDLSGRAGDRALLLGSRQPYMPASTIKLALVSALMQQVDAGRLSLEQHVTVEPDDVVGGTGSLQKETFPQEVTIERLARLMITQSDNTATNVLVDVVGLEQVDALMDQLNLKVMHLGRKMFAAAPTPAQDNYIDAADLVTLLEHIYKGTFLSDRSRDQIVTWMKAQEVKTKFGAALPDAPIAHKTGENANVTHDVGYFLMPGKEIAISVLTEVTTTGDFDEAQATGNPVVQQIAKTVYRTLGYESKYADVEPGHWAKSFIDGASAASLIDAEAAASFRPDQPITRAAWISLLVRSFGLQPAGDGSPAAGASAGGPLETAMAAAQAAGMVSGPAGDASSLEEPVTRAEAALMMTRAYEYVRGPIAGSTEPLPFRDAAVIPASMKEAVAKAQRLGWIDGYEDGSFRPGGPITRAEAVKLIASVLGM
ncbi:serine hydrolase [Paenibacillus allorhizosphaerae]|uniref:SLH domain-containing protein n=1 Tax=Paenibacillus allorhizosphaerae TaxID=2849866 RepID=A0ABM8VQ89_9BACL|nr:serine hydrolase [Paenibacillus allorhizosphaerae]CAG7653920.1 hypothetical protein PAECIP111802_05622 [Paenibacillus allorhizosphaerae]